MRFSPFALVLALAGCSILQPSPAVVQPRADWRLVATPADRARLSAWRATFSEAIAAARAAGHAQDIAREGALLDPDSALPGPAIPDGIYRCRVIKLGAKSAGLLDYVSYPAFTCRVAGEGRARSFAKLTGSQRHVGLILPGDSIRQVFLGTLVLGDEARAQRYGFDPERDVAGFVERIGPRRWRIVMPRPHFESQLDVMELVPAP